VCSLSEFQSFLINPPELSGSNQQTSGKEAGETWLEIAVNFAYEDSISYSAGFFNML
jgi:hypothetical protein